jgi:hypothetical protein
LIEGERERERERWRGLDMDGREGRSGMDFGWANVGTLRVGSIMNHPVEI